MTAIKNGTYVVLTHDLTFTHPHTGTKVFPAGTVLSYRKYRGEVTLSNLVRWNSYILYRQYLDADPQFVPVTKAQGVVELLNQELIERNRRNEENYEKAKALLANPPEGRNAEWQIRNAQHTVDHYQPNPYVEQAWEKQFKHKLLIMDQHFEIGNVYPHKRKIQFRIPKDMTRQQLIEKLCAEVGYDWVGMTFKTTGAIWW